MGTELLVLAKVQHILLEIVTILSIQTFRMQECAKTFDNEFQLSKILGKCHLWVQNYWCWQFGCMQSLLIGCTNGQVLGGRETVGKMLLQSHGP